MATLLCPPLLPASSQRGRAAVTAPPHRHHRRGHPRHPRHRRPRPQLVARAGPGPRPAPGSPAVVVAVAGLVAVCCGLLRAMTTADTAAAARASLGPGLGLTAHWAGLGAGRGGGGALGGGGVAGGQQQQQLHGGAELCLLLLLPSPQPHHTTPAPAAVLSRSCGQPSPAQPSPAQARRKPRPARHLASTAAAQPSSSALVATIIS